jgi:putative ABC transport system ATP-binding protein
MEVFQTLNDRGITIVLVTHEPDIASFAKRTVLFRDGKILRDSAVQGRRNAGEVLASLPVVEEEGTI